MGLKMIQKKVMGKKLWNILDYGLCKKIFLEPIFNNSELVWNSAVFDKPLWFLVRKFSLGTHIH